jgi:uncharacterized glyoxalase superfamily protein PhnB
MAKASKPGAVRAAKRSTTTAATAQRAVPGTGRRMKGKAKPAGGSGSRGVKRAAKPEPVVRARPETLRLRSVAASLTVADLARSLALYGKGFGFFLHERWETDGKLVGVTLRAGTCELNLSQDDGVKGLERRKGEGIRLWLETVQDLDALAERAESFGARITAWPADQEWGVRSFSADDLDGYHLSFFRRL